MIRRAAELTLISERDDPTASFERLLCVKSKATIKQKV